MIHTHPVQLQPFPVPNCVLATPPLRRAEDEDLFYVEVPGFPLKEVAADTLASMCDEFRLAVFAKAGKTPPDRTAEVAS